MPGFLAALASPIVGAIGGGVMNLIGGERANASNAHQAMLNRRFQEDMSNTSYQRAVADMRAAGLNPALAYQQGGSSTPGGAQATMSNTLGPAASSALATAQAYAGIAATGAQIEKTQQETAQMTWEHRMRTTWETYELAARLAELEERRDTAALRGSKPFLDLIVKQMQSDLKLTDTSARGAAATARITEFGVPAAQNAARAANTWWGRYIAPFLGDAKTATSLAIPRGRR